MSNRLIESLEDVYTKVFGPEWRGEDPKALTERLDNLIDSEDRLNELSLKIKEMRKFLTGL